MKPSMDSILTKQIHNSDDIFQMLNSKEDERKKLFEYAAKIKKETVGNKVYFRGLIEYSNICAKDCYYCGIRKSNKKITRYTMSDTEVIDAVKYAHKENYASIVLQAGEISSPQQTKNITNLLNQIAKATNNELGITLSLGEQREETLKEWKNAGARRYLLRIEASSPELYSKIHPDNPMHKIETRIETLKLLQKTGYQTGTGVMVGLPFQTAEDLVSDIEFIRDNNIDMVGLGPYIEHKDTPLYSLRNTLLPQKERFDLSLKMIAILRIIMKDINIAASTAMQAIDKIGREKALKVGANIIMPNLTPVKYRESYLLYEDKPCIDEEAEECKNCLEARIVMAGDEIGYGEWGDSKRFFARQKHA